jgi:hypothetical protein
MPASVIAFNCGVRKARTEEGDAACIRAELCDRIGGDPVVFDIRPGVTTILRVVPMRFWNNRIPGRAHWVDRRRRSVRAESAPRHRCGDGNRTRWQALLSLGDSVPTELGTAVCANAPKLAARDSRERGLTDLLKKLPPSGVAVHRLATSQRAAIIA